MLLLKQHMTFVIMFLRSVFCSILFIASGLNTAGGNSGGYASAANSKQRIDSVTSTSAPFKKNLPVKETLPDGYAVSNTMVFMISGDSGWSNFNQKTANQFASQGIPVVGLNALKYFWHKKDLQQISSDAEYVISRYAALWHKEHIILIGYSFGADVIPFIYNRLTANLRHKIASIGLMSPSESTDFEVHLSEIFNIASTKRSFDVPGEISKISTVPLTCFFGKKEAHIAASVLPKECNIVYVQGGHQYEDSFVTIYDSIVR